MFTNLPGLGVFLPAHWTLPQNPLEMRAGLCNYGIGAIVEGFPVLPENPIVVELLGKEKMAEALQKNPLGPVGLSCGPVGLCGMVDDVMNSVTTSMGDWKTWAIVGAGVLGLVMLTGGGGSQRRAELTAARAQYKSKVATIRASRPRRYQKFV